jgi:hypothetical protein
MNRRSILGLFGLLPFAGVAAALPRVADPVKLASTGGREVSAKAPFVFNDGKLYMDSIVDDVNRSLAEKLEWINSHIEQAKRLSK